MDTGDVRFREIGDAVRDVGRQVTATREELTEIKTKVGLYGALGGLAGSTVVGVIIAIGTRAFG